MFTSILPRTIAVALVPRAAIACPRDRCYSDLPRTARWRWWCPRRRGRGCGEPPSSLCKSLMWMAPPSAAPTTQRRLATCWRMSPWTHFTSKYEPCRSEVAVNPFHCHDVNWKRPIEVQNLKPLSLFVIFFTPVCERIFIKSHSIKSRCIRGPENILCAGASMHLSARKFYRMGHEGVKAGHEKYNLWKMYSLLCQQIKTCLPCIHFQPRWYQLRSNLANCILLNVI